MYYGSILLHPHRVVVRIAFCINLLNFIQIGQRTAELLRHDVMTWICDVLLGSSNKDSLLCVDIASRQQVKDRQHSTLNTAFYPHHSILDGAPSLFFLLRYMFRIFNCFF